MPQSGEQIKIKYQYLNYSPALLAGIVRGSHLQKSSVVSLPFGDPVLEKRDRRAPAAAAALGLAWCDRFFPFPFSARVLWPVPCHKSGQSHSAMVVCQQMRAGQPPNARKWFGNKGGSTCAQANCRHIK